MGRVLALGGTHELDGFALAGVDVVHARTDDEVRRAWRELGSDVGLVILSPDAAESLRGDLEDRPDVLTAVMP